MYEDSWQGYDRIKRVLVLFLLAYHFSCWDKGTFMLVWDRPCLIMEQYSYSISKL